MRAIAKIIATATLASGIALGIGVAPAHASSLRGVYYDQADCYRAGWYGHDNYGWGWPQCLQRDPYGQPQVYWFLYA